MYINMYRFESYPALNKYVLPNAGALRKLYHFNMDMIILHIEN